MGGTGSKPELYADSGASSSDIKRLELFSKIFLRLLQSSDILDIRALTRGPKQCGDYVVLLEKNLAKEFNKIKLTSTEPGQTSIDTFLFSRSKSIVEESPSDAVACRSLAVFYIRALQLVGALTMSIYTPPDLVSRIRKRVLDETTKVQARDVPLSARQIEDMRIKREAWLKNIMSDSGSSGIATLRGHPQFKYNKASRILTYNDPETKYEYKAKLAVEELSRYKFVEFFEGNKLEQAEAYWVIVTNEDKTPPEPIFRAIVYKNMSAYIFGAKIDITVEAESPTEFLRDWASELSEIVSNNITGRAPPPPPKNSGLGSMSGLYGPYNGRGGRRRTYKRGGGDKNYPNFQRNADKRGTAKNSNSKNINERERAKRLLDLSTDTTLPRRFQESYKSMVTWTADIAEWSEAAPASYRSILLYNKAVTSTTLGASYMCVDNWAKKSMKLIPPFAALESLYYEQDDGSIGPENAESLKALADAFNTIYIPHRSSTESSNAPKKIETLTDVIVPAVKEGIKNLFCTKRSAQGDVLLDPKYSNILEKAQAAITKQYALQFDACFNILAQIFTTTNNGVGGELKIQFAPIFANKGTSARATLEELIVVARQTVALHYTEVERIYFQALQDLVNMSPLQNPSQRR